MLPHHHHHLLLLLLLQLLLHLPYTASTCPPTPRLTNCLPSLTTQPSLYTACLTTPCYLFISSPPFTIIPSPPPPPRPFPCASPAPYTGLSFTIHQYTPSALCLYAGPKCSSDDLLHFTRTYSNYSFAVTGMLIHTPQTLCYHTPAAAILEDEMVIIGKAQFGRRVDHLVKPFSITTWIIFIIALAIIVTTACCIAFFTRGKPSIVSTIFIASGDSSAALSRTSTTSDKTPYTLSTTLVKFAIAALVTVLALFYEAAVVNFLFQQNKAQLGKRVRALSKGELGRYAVLKESALERVWNDTVNPNGQLYDPRRENPPWKRCDTPEQCVRWVVDNVNGVLFDVTFGISARFLIQQMSSCDKLTIFQTQDILYQFTGGWLYNQAITRDYRQRIDRLLIGLRINRTLGRIFDQSLDKSACAQTVSPQLGPLIVAVPLLIFVFPPLIASVLILFYMKDKKNHMNNHDKKNEPVATTVVDSPDANDDAKNTSAELSISADDLRRRTSTQELEEITFP